jgi:hypothetical protein
VDPPAIVAVTVAVATMAARHKAKVITGDGPRTCFEARLQRTGKKDLIGSSPPVSREGYRG